MTPRSLSLFTLLSILILTGCDSNSDESCLTVTPDDRYTISGTAQTTTFTPETKTYSVRNTCTEDVMLSVEEDVRWLDVEIPAFGEIDESGMLGAGTSIDVDIEVRYGSDNAERLNQLAAGTYGTDLRFEDDTNGDTVTRLVELTVNAAP